MRAAIVLVMLTGCVTLKHSPPTTTVGNNNSVHVTINEVVKEVPVEKIVYVDRPVEIEKIVYQSSNWSMPNLECKKVCAHVLAGLTIASLAVGSFVGADYVFDNVDRSSGEILGATGVGLLLISPLVFIGIEHSF